MKAQERQFDPLLGMSGSGGLCPTPISATGEPAVEEHLTADQSI